MPIRNIKLQCAILSQALHKKRRSILLQKLSALFSQNGYDDKDSRKVAEATLSIFGRFMPVRVKEVKIRELLSSVTLSPKSFFLKEQLPPSLYENILNGLRERTAQLLREIEDWVVGPRVLDFGCGNGYVGRAMRDTLKKDVVLMDIANLNKTDLPFILYNGKIPFSENHFDTVTLFMVLHHSADYGSALAEAKRVGKRLIIIETIPDESAGKSETMFFDWFYNNAVLGYNMPIPGNFLTSAEWLRLFQTHGLRVIHERNLGMNYKNILLNHYLFVLEK